MNDTILALDLMGRFREELSRGLFAEDISIAGGGGELVGGVGLTETELARGLTKRARSNKEGWREDLLD